MKKITLKFLIAVMLVLSYNGMAQTLNQAASWPNAAWTLSGTYTGVGLLSDPAVGATFSFDDDAAGNGSADNIQTTSPVIDLTPASVAGETWVTISSDYVYRPLGGDILAIEIYDADAMTWTAVETFAGNSTNTDYQTCASIVPYTTAVINIAGYTSTQLSGFQYRFSYDDLGGWQWGFCLTSPTITSATPPACPDPVALTATVIDGFSADLGWTETGSATSWNIELVDITAGGTVTGTATSSGVSNPFNQTGLVPSNNYEFYVQADCGGVGTSNWIGPIAFTTTVACPDPSGLTTTNVLTTSADLGWTAGGSETLWDIELVDITAGGTVTGTATTSGVANPYNQTGLTANNAYEFYVRADCVVNGTSGWVGPFAFTTACTTFTAPYTEDFENAGSVPDCWSLGGDENWLFNTAGPNHVGNNGTITGSTLSGNYYAVVDDSTPDATNAELTSPFIDVSGLAVPALLFHEISNNEGGPNATLTVSVWDGAAWNVVAVYNSNSLSGAWEQKVINLSGLTFTGDAQVRFSVADSGDFLDDIAIDDVTLDELPSCPDPSALTAVNITDTTADLGWTEVGSATLWNIEIVDVTAGGTVTGVATVTGVTNPYMAMGLTENNSYEFYVQSDCGVDGTSNWIGPFAFATIETCPAPSALTATNILETSADLGWTENGAATSWNIELVDVTAGGTVTGTATASGVANPYNVTGLVGDNTYEFYVQADCGVDGVSAWAGPFSFATPYVAVPPDCTNGIFLDSGGNSGSYANNESTSTTIFPDAAGEVVTITFTYVDLESSGGAGAQDGCWDFLTIYDGPDNTFPVLAQTLCGEESGDGGVPSVASSELNIGDSFTSTDPSGALTIEFNSDGSVPETGWAATVTCATLSLGEIDNPSAFTYYPNPVKNTLTLNAQNNIENVTMYNMLGQVVMNTTPNTVDSDIDMSNLQTGTYFVKVTIVNATKTIRVIKQ
ncbi:Por secretion system C-terminal sorting domain-containing protein [Formosa sp. Hel1_31_208]|uniref:fibronectin type III domain-containing protein n=1 Tax=Formosa sp. Hel1_31_208 TaxID=1798225 RepID=UPI00087965CE|nr:fibronectin type III domain-containing protein [Formosa sp. Hel1_31_208]SDS53552.1 Por secretion system C-terminal sorting domain-containing protein [Formosa sp. Hel1_31_208]